MLGREVMKSTRGKEKRRNRGEAKKPCCSFSQSYISGINVFSFGSDVFSHGVGGYWDGGER